MAARNGCSGELGGIELRNSRGGMLVPLHRPRVRAFRAELLP